MHNIPHRALTSQDIATVAAVLSSLENDSYPLPDYQLVRLCRTFAAMISPTSVQLHSAAFLGTAGTCDLQRFCISSLPVSGIFGCCALGPIPSLFVFTVVIFQVTGILQPTIFTHHVSQKSFVSMTSAWAVLYCVQSDVTKAPLPIAECVPTVLLLMDYHWSSTLISHHCTRAVAALSVGHASILNSSGKFF